MASADTDFCWQVEMACRAAWPAETERVEHGWHFRRSGGAIRRVNSVNQLAGSPPVDDALADRAEAFYADFGQRSIFRLMSFAGDEAACLDRRGYEIHGNTLTLHATLVDMPPVDTDAVHLSDEPEEGWLAVRERNAGSDHSIFKSMLSLIEGLRLFASTGEGGETVSIAYGVIRDGLLIVEAVATDSDHRGRGHARRTVGALMERARISGASDAALQVVADNPPARALYRGLGFGNELFSYHYRYKPEPA